MFAKGFAALFLVAGLILPLPALAKDNPSPPEEGLVKPSEQIAKEEKDDGWKVDFTAAWLSKYVSKGVVTVDDPVLQPAVNLYKGAFTFNVWGNYDLTNKNGNRNNMTEINVVGEYDFQVGDLHIPVGAIYYSYPNTEAKDTLELTLALYYDWIIKPGVKVFRDVNQVHGTYVEFGAGYEVDLPGLPQDFGWGLAMLVKAGWGDAEYNKFNFNGVDQNHFTDIQADLGLPFKYKEVLTVMPSVSYMSLLDGDIRDAMEHKDATWWGVTVSLSF